jgi:hypothetical protein
MAQSLAKVLVHLIYSTKHRAKLLPHEHTTRCTPTAAEC